MVAKKKPKKGRPPNPPSPKEMLKDTLPISSIFNEEEVELYNKLVDVYIDDFEIDDLTSSDMDDILDLAKNRVLEFRLLKKGKDDIDSQLDTAATIEKLGKKNEKIKESLSSRRKDRLNPNEFKGFSIVDLVVAYDQSKKEALAKKMSALEAEELELLKKRINYKGNRFDVDIENEDE